MPLIEVKMLEGRSQEEKRTLAAEITNLMVTIAGAKKESVSVIIWETGAANWATAGELIADRKKR